MQDTMIEIINTYGYLGIFLLILVENLFPPIPSEVVLLFGGALTVGTSMTIPLVILSATLGSLLGAVVLYMLGRILKAERIKKLFSGRFGKLFHMKPAYVDKASIWFYRYQNRAVLICRCIPLIRSLISIPAGINSMNVPLFLLLTAIGSILWNTVLVLAGAFFGNAWQDALPFVKEYSVIIISICGVASVAYLIFKLCKRGTMNAS